MLRNKRFAKMQTEGCSKTANYNISRQTFEDNARLEAEYYANQQLAFIMNPGIALEK